MIADPERLCSDFAAAHGISVDAAMELAVDHAGDEAAMRAELDRVRAAATAQANGRPQAARSPRVESRPKRKTSMARTGRCPDGSSPAKVCAWISRALAWDAHPVTAAHRSGGVRSSRITFERDGAPVVVVPFASLVDPRLLVAELSCQRVPADDRVPADIDPDLCRELCFAVNQLCDLRAETAAEQAAAIFGELERVGTQACPEMEFSCEGDTVARYRLLGALSPMHGLPCYVLDAGRPVAAISDLLAAARRLPDDYKDVQGIFEAAGWEPRRLQGYARRGKDRKDNPHRGPVVVFRAPDRWRVNEDERRVNEGVNELLPAGSPCKSGGERGERVALACAPVREASSLPCIDDLRARCPEGLGSLSGRRVRWHSPVRQFLARRDGGACAVCGGDLREGDVHIDHVVPLALHGPHAVDNLQLLCVPCHDAKTTEDRRRIRAASEPPPDGVPILWTFPYEGGPVTVDVAGAPVVVGSRAERDRLLAVADA